MLSICSIFSEAGRSSKPAAAHRAPWQRTPAQPESEPRHRICPDRLPDQHTNHCRCERARSTTSQLLAFTNMNLRSNSSLTFRATGSDSGGAFG